MSTEPARLRTLQPGAWRRVLGVGIIAVIVLSVVLQEPVAALLPEDTPRWLLFLVIAVPVAGALVLGLSLAYPRVLLDADGSLRVGRRVVPLAEVVGLRRSVSSGPSAGYLVYTLVPREGRAIRVLVAGAPVRGLALDQLAVLREAVAASAIPVAQNAAEVERAIIGQNLLADGRRAEVDRDRALRELDALRGVAHHPGPSPGVPDAAPVEAQVEAPALSSAVEPENPASDSWTAAAQSDDLDAAQELGAATAGTRMLRRVALAACVVVCLVAAGLLITLVIREASGAWVGDASEDPVVGGLLIAMLLALVTGVVWAFGADLDDARTRQLSTRWLAEATETQRRRGMPSPFHTAWMRAPGGRLTGLGMFVAGMVAMVAIVGGPVALFGGFGPALIGGIVTVVGVGLSALLLWGWFARRRALARRVEWLLEVAGERVHGGDAPPDNVDPGR